MSVREAGTLLSAEGKASRFIFAFVSSSFYKSYTHESQKCTRVMHVCLYVYIHTRMFVQIIRCLALIIIPFRSSLVWSSCNGEASERPITSELGRRFEKRRSNLGFGATPGTLVGGGGGGASAIEGGGEGEGGGGEIGCWTEEREGVRGGRRGKRVWEGEAGRE